MLALRTVLAGSLLFVSWAGAQTLPLPSGLRPDPSPTAPTLKSPRTARVLAIIPGAGHMYAGEPESGIAILALMGGALAAGVLATGIDCFSKVFSSDQRDCGRTALTVTWIAVGGIWVVSIVDAGNAARRTNARRAGRASFILEPTRPRAPFGDDHTVVRLGMRVMVW